MDYLTDDDVQKALLAVLAKSAEKSTSLDGNKDRRVKMLNRIKQLAIEFGVISDVRGIVDIDIHKNITISSEQIEYIKLLYTSYLKRPNIKYTQTFSFSTKTILYVSSSSFDETTESSHQELTRIDRLAQSLYTVIYKCITDFKKNPTKDNYIKIVGKFNKAANDINQFFNLLEHKAISIIPTFQEKRLPGTNYRHGIWTDLLYNVDLDEDELKELSGWKLELVQLEKQHDINWVKKYRIDLYNQMVSFHRKDKTLVHENPNKHYWDRDKIWYYAKIMIDFFKNRKYCGVVTRNNIDTYCRHFDKYTQFGKTTPNFDATIRIGDICIQCPCLENYFPCKCLFKLSDPSTFEAFTKAMVGYSHKVDLNDMMIQIADPVETLLKYIEIRKDPSKSPNLRLNTTCPKCSYINTFENKEAIRNSTGENPLLQHPSDVICGRCQHEYCTDCKRTHKGFICRGFPEEDDCNKQIELCPACGHTTDRISGCTCITCEIPSCGKTWCWICRCLRHPEHSSNTIHYCITQNRGNTNPNWRLNPNVVLCTEVAPVSLDGMDFVP